MTETCTRCGTEVPTKMPTEGTRYQIRVFREVKTVVHRLRFFMHRFTWLPENPADQIRTAYTDLALCDPCAGVVFMYAQGKGTVAAVVTVARVLGEHPDLVGRLPHTQTTYWKCSGCGTAMPDGSDAALRVHQANQLAKAGLVNARAETGA